MANSTETSSLFSCVTSNNISNHDDNIYNNNHNITINNKYDNNKRCDDDGDDDDDDDDTKICHHLAKVEFVPGNTTVVPMDLSAHHTWTVTINRGKEGFGFTVFGCSPVQVGRVEEGSSAWMSELRQDDCIVKINGLNVSRSTAESVAKLVRNSKTQITLEVFKPSIITQQQQLHYNSDSGVVADSTSMSSASSCYHDNNNNNAMFYDHIGRSSSLSSSSSNSSIFYSASMVDESSFHHNKDACDRRIKTNKDFKGNLQQQQRKPLSTVTNKITVTNNSQRLNSATHQNNNNNNNYDTINSRTNGCLPRMGIKSKKSTSNFKDNTNIRTTTSQTSTNTNNYKHADTQESAADDQSKVLEIETKLGKCLEDMVTCLEEFVGAGHLGVNKFMRPLRAAGLSQEQFSTLFQNIEITINLSEQLLDHVKQSSNSDNTSFDTDQSESFFSSHVLLESLETFLDAKVEALCDNYESYCIGLRQALITFVALKKDPKFGPIINNNNNNNFVPDDVTLSSFLQQPLKHIKDLIVHLQETTYTSLQMGYDNDGLKKIVHILLQSCNRINENHRSLSNLSLNTITSSVLSLTHHHHDLDDLRSNPFKGQGRSPLMHSFTPPFPRSPNNNNNNMASSPLSSSVVSSVDKELLEIQTKLVFPAHVRAFQLATASRHLIYAGTLELVDQERCHGYVLLTSDLLLLMECDYERKLLVVVEDPIMLVNVVGCEFNDASPLELLISVETRLTSLQSPWAPKTFCLRAQSEELKVTWKNVLEQRILNCKNEREITLNNRSMDNFV